jgi:hypothetical protein
LLSCPFNIVPLSFPPNLVLKFFVALLISEWLNLPKMVEVPAKQSC